MEAESEEIIALQNVTLESQTLKETIQSADENVDEKQREEITESLARVEEGIAGSGQQKTPKKPAAARCAKLPSWNSFKTLAVFLLFRVILPSSDVVTDLATGFSLCQRGHLWWGNVTVFLIYCPFLAGLIKYLVKKKWPFYFDDPIARHDSKLTEDTGWLLPLVQPLV